MWSGSFSTETSTSQYQHRNTPDSCSSSPRASSSSTVNLDRSATVDSLFSGCLIGGKQGRSSPSSGGAICETKSGSSTATADNKLFKAPSMSGHLLGHCFRTKCQKRDKTCSSSSGSERPCRSCISSKISARHAARTCSSFSTCKEGQDERVFIGYKR